MRVLAKSLDVYITVSVMTHYRSYNEIYSSSSSSNNNNNNIYICARVRLIVATLSPSSYSSSSSSDHVFDVVRRREQRESTPLLRLVRAERGKCGGWRCQV